MGLASHPSFPLSALISPPLSPRPKRRGLASVRCPFPAARAPTQSLLSPHSAFCIAFPPPPFRLCHPDRSGGVSPRIPPFPVSGFRSPGLPRRSQRRSRVLCSALCLLHCFSPSPMPKSTPATQSPKPVLLAGRVGRRGEKHARLGRKKTTGTPASAAAKAGRRHEVTASPKRGNHASRR